jgi:hypothetical protein
MLMLAACVSASSAAPVSITAASILGEPLVIEAPSAAPDTTEKSGDIRKIASFPYKGGTDIAFSGNFVYAAKQGDKGGVYVFDVSRPRPKQIAFIPCPGTQNDVAVVRPGLIALGFYSGTCGRVAESGVRLIDVRDPSSPRLLDTIGFTDGAHTLTVFPGKPLIYVSPGGLAENGGTEYILDASDPNHLKVVEEYVPNPFGCHDVSFHLTASRQLGFCPGQLETEVWDVSNPRKPQVLAEIPPIMEFPHSAVASPDGKLLVIGDESLFTAHDCVTGQSVLGALYAYDITDPADPVFEGRISSPRGGAQLGTPLTPACTAHNFNFAGGTRKVVASWYTGGTSVIDFTTPSAPKEIAYYRPDDANTWSSYFYRGQVFASDGNRGLEVLESILLPPRPPRPQPIPKPPPGDDKPKPPPDDKPKPPPDDDKPKPCWVWDDAERSFVEKINQERERRGLRRVKIDPELSKVAQVHSDEMLSKHHLHHTPEETLKRRVTRWQILGENVGVGQSVDSLHRAFMESQEHRDIVLYPDFRYVGTGVSYGRDRMWVTVVFEAYEDPGTTLKMPKTC